MTKGSAHIYIEYNCWRTLAVYVLRFLFTLPLKPKQFPHCAHNILK